MTKTVITPEKTSLTDEQELAIVLHDKLCRVEHVEACSWFYEVNGKTHDWKRYAHEKYLKKATNVMTELPHLAIEENAEVISIVA